MATKVLLRSGGKSAHRKIPCNAQQTHSDIHTAIVIDKHHVTRDGTKPHIRY